MEKKDLKKIIKSEQPNSRVRNKQIQQLYKNMNKSLNNKDKNEQE